ncbi:MAG: hypothetical protein FWD71_00670 [Oscillospiraceae bacterium]|nr:hypothetical protein [Oscillospiraceae bacterium]
MKNIKKIITGVLLTAILFTIINCGGTSGTLAQSSKSEQPTDVVVLTQTHYKKFLYL